VSEGDQNVERFSLPTRIQHMVLAASCLILIATGMPLKFPYWRTSQVYFSLTGGVHTSGIVHRMGAIALISVGTLHMFWAVFTKEGRRNLRSLLPSFYDVKTVFVNVLWFLGLGKGEAKFGRYSYIEKFDYWAVYWGCVIMIGSGLVLWFENLSMRYLPKLAVDVAHEAHSDEGLLATLAIVIWHFYNVHLNPDHFPMNWAWLTGQVSKKQLMEHHPLEYEEMLEEQATDGESGAHDE